MIALAVVTAKLADIAERLDMVKKHRLAAADGYAASPEARDLVAFNLMLAVQSAADLAAHAISDENLPPARTAAEAFERLAQHGVIAQDLASTLQRAVAFRNVVAHGYARLDLALLHDAATAGAQDLERFAAQFARWMETRRGVT